MSESMALIDFPMALLQYMTTMLPAQSAARLRTTCKLLQRVIDTTWDPDEPIPPHRRSTPLTFDQVKAQLPQHKPWPEWVKQAASLQRGATISDEVMLQDVLGLADRCSLDDKQFEVLEPQDGCDPYCLEVFGPALTRLTANQAVNLLQGKPVLGVMFRGFLDLSKYSTAFERMHEVEEVTFRNLKVNWPPKKRGDIASDSEGEAEVMSGAASAPGSDFQPWWAPSRGTASWLAGRGNGNWLQDEVVFSGKCDKPSSTRMRGQWGGCSNAEPYEFCVKAHDRLLSTTDSSCRRASEEEVEQFVASESPSVGDKYDLYLSSEGSRGTRDIYVFLDPGEPRFTGHPKGFGSAPAMPAAVGRVDAAAGAAPTAAPAATGSLFIFKARGAACTTI